MNVDPADGGAAEAGERHAVADLTPTGPHVVLRAGLVLEPGGGFRRADVSVDRGVITAVGDDIAAEPGAVVVDCRGRIILPGFVDAHSHADAALFDRTVQLALLRQGVTSVVIGQDGIGFAPGDGSYATRYFATVNGEHRTYRGDGIAALLETYECTTALNVAALVPAGTVRHEVRGDSPGAATDAELAAMRALVRRGLNEGAVGLSTGLDYVPGLFADERELIALCREVSASGALYVSHIRGGYEANLRVGLDEVERIVAATGVRAHVSHLHGPVALATGLLDGLERRGIRLSFDSYPYSRGCTILSMLMLPPDLASPGTRSLEAAVSTPRGREQVRRAMLDRVMSRADLGADWADSITLSHVGAEEHRRHEGRTLAEAGRDDHLDPISVAIDVLVASRLQVNAIMRVPTPRTAEELAPLYARPGHTGGSDGIFVGTHPHPRAYGTFARYLADYARSGILDWPRVVDHLSSSAVRLFRLGKRGQVTPGWVADLLVVDPENVEPTSTYDRPVALATGIDDVLVAGALVLSEGQLTGATPGVALRPE